MYKVTKNPKTTLKVNESYEGETIEAKVMRILNNKEPIKDGAPLIYTERKDGVQPDYNIRTDRFEHAIDATDYITKSHIAKREERQKQNNLKVVKDDDKKGDGGPESIPDSKQA